MSQAQRPQNDNPFLALPGGLPTDAAAPAAAVPATFSPHAAAAPSRPEVSLLKRVHALLRGRYWIVIICCTLGALGGGFAGWRSQVPQFTSTGYVELNLIVQSINRDDRMMLMASQFMGNQVNIIQTQRVLDAAMGSRDWEKTGKGVSPAAQADFRSRLDVDIVPGTTYIRISYTDPDPAVAKAAVTSVIYAYRALYTEVNSREARIKQNVLQDAAEQKRRDIEAAKRQILAQARTFGTANLEAYHNAKLAQLVSLESELDTAKESLAALTRGLSAQQAAQQAAATSPKSISPPADSATASLTIDPASFFAAVDNPSSATPSTRPAASLIADTGLLSPTEIATVDPSIRVLISQVRDAEFQLKRLSMRYPLSNRVVVDATHDLQLLQAQLDDACRTFRGKYVSIRTDPVTGQLTPISSDTVSAMQSRVDLLQARYDREKAETTRIGEVKLAIQALNNDIDRLKGEVDQIDRAKEALDSQSRLSGDLNVIDEGSLPSAPSRDKRKQMAGLGLAAGILLPFGALLVVGLLDSRYRFSDDHGQHLPHVPLLGILPNLPNLSTDPHQATIAAHCVHQIRTMLEIAADTQGRRSFAITSPSPTDGKTSLSLALGLSFAAAGTRTLLIDCDVIGGGLSARMNQTHPIGTLEAVAARQLAPFVQPTDIANLFILPVGTSSALHPTILSPTALARLIADARASYDIVLVDTGPVLGSVEASPACAACDATVLVVSRGRQKAQVARAMDQLLSIGARLAGVVFNRASHPDFDRSMSRLAVRHDTTPTVQA